MVTATTAYPGDLDYRDQSASRRFGELIPEPEGGIRTADPVDGRPTLALLSSAWSRKIRAALQWRISMPADGPHCRN